MVSQITAFGISALFAGLFGMMLANTIPTILPLVNIAFTGSIIVGISTLAIKGAYTIRNP